jgi:hypothetical protein
MLSSPLSLLQLTYMTQERLKSHARAFDSLLSLIPAKVYYGEDVSVCKGVGCIRLDTD